MACSTFFKFSAFNLRNYIFQSTKKCKMTSFSMTSLHADLNEAPKCVDIIPTTFAASLSHLRWRRYLAELTKINCRIYESSMHENLERTHDWCSAVGKVAFINDFVHPGLFL